MTDIEKRAHDITVSILPKMMEEDGMPCFVPSKNRNDETFNTAEISDLYCSVYEALLKDLEEYGLL